MNIRTLFALILRVCLPAWSLVFTLSMRSAEAQKSYPGWSAPKIIPTESTLSTYPDIAAVGDTLHVVFRSTTTILPESGGPSDQDLIEEEILKIQTLLRQGSTEDIDALGGKKKIQEKLQELTKKLRDIQNKPVSTGPATGSPITTTICYTRSDDRGRTWWEKPVVIARNPDGFMGQTAIYVDSNGIHVIYTATHQENIIHLFYIHSVDDGKTWSGPQQVSQSTYDKMDPQLAPTPNGGLVVCWWELEEAEIEERRRPTFETFDSFLQDPSIETKISTRTRTIIHYARLMAGGAWQGDQILDNATELVTSLCLSTGRDDNIFLYWLDKDGFDCRTSRDGGQTWETTLAYQQLIDTRLFNTFLYDGTEPCFIRGPLELNKAGQLAYRRGLTGGEDWVNIIDGQAQQSHPQIAFTNGEIQVVWGITDLSGRHILYFRQDNKPPVSRLDYPPNGDLAKTQASFVWGATDDIATRLTFRWCSIKREDPKTRPAPTGWTLYDEIKSQTIPAPPDAYYTFYLQAVDFSGNEEKEPIALDYHTYFVPPTITADTATVPPLVINSRNLEIKWRTEDNNPQNQVLVAYQVDGQTPSEFAARDSVKITGLSTGWHRIQLLAVDGNGNVNAFGDEVSVKVELELGLEWQQIPVSPREENRVVLKDPSVPLAWRVFENTRDQGINYLSSYLVTHDGRARNWTTPQTELKCVLTGLNGGEIEEGDYRVQLVAQDEFGNPAFPVGRADKVIETTFTVDHTPPVITWNPPFIDPNTKIPTLTVTGEDKVSKAENLEYKFRIAGATEGGWTEWAKNTSYVCAGRPISWYSWGYKVEVKSRDVAGNENRYPARYSLIWYDRSPATLYAVIGIAVLIALILIFLVIAGMLERSRARKRAAARKAAAMKPVEAEPEPEKEKRPAKTDDLFGMPTMDMSAGTVTEAPVSSSSYDFSSSASFDDLFGTSQPQTAEEPTTPEEDIFASTFSEAPSLDFTNDEETIIIEDPFKAPPKPEPKKEQDWSSDDKVDLTDHDLFDPL